MSKATMTIEGYVAKDPEVRDVNGQQVVTVTIPHTPRRKNKQTGQFEDAGTTLWVQAAFWGEDGNPIIDRVRKGALVTVTGQPELNVYTKQDGTADAQIRLRFATLGVIPRADQGQTWQAPAQADSWGTPAVDYADSTPF